MFWIINLENYHTHVVVQGLRIRNLLLHTKVTKSFIVLFIESFDSIEAFEINFIWIEHGFSYHIQYAYFRHVKRKMLRRFVFKNSLLYRFVLLNSSLNIKLGIHEFVQISIRLYMARVGKLNKTSHLLFSEITRESNEHI